jgi:hypothetical protein
MGRADPYNPLLSGEAGSFAKQYKELILLVSTR